MQHIEGQYTAAEVDTPDIAEEEAARRTLPADPEVKNFSYTVVDGEVFYRENSVMKMCIRDRLKLVTDAEFGELEFPPD